MYHVCTYTFSTCVLVVLAMATGCKVVKVGRVNIWQCFVHWQGLTLVLASTDTTHCVWSWLTEAWMNYVVSLLERMPSHKQNGLLGEGDKIWHGQSENDYLYMHMPLLPCIRLWNFYCHAHCWRESPIHKHSLVTRRWWTIKLNIIFFPFDR